MTAERLRLAFAERTERHVDVAQLDVDHRFAGGVRGVAGDIAGALTVADQPEPCGPSLSHHRNKARPARKFSGAEWSEQPFGLEPPAKIRRIREKVRLHTDRLGALDVDLAVVD